MNIQDLIEAIRQHHIRITDHADEEAQTDRLSFEETFFSVFQGEIIEEYPEDKPYPSCLVYGESFKSEPIHSVWAYNTNNGWAVLSRCIDLPQSDGSTGVSGERHDAV